MCALCLLALSQGRAEHDNVTGLRYKQNPRLGSKLLLGSKMESNDVAKVAMNELWGILFNLINMVGMAEPVRCNG